MIAEEIIKICGCDKLWKGQMQAWVWKYWEKMKHQEVVAYKKDLLGITIILKGIRKYFCFTLLTKDISFGAYDYRMTRHDKNRVAMRKIVGSIENSGTILQKDNFTDLKNRLVLEAI